MPDDKVVDLKVEELAPKLVSAPPPPPATVQVVMHGRRPWVVGESIGLSRGYTFTPGSPVVVPAADAKILCGKVWDGRRFERLSTTD